MSPALISRIARFLTMLAAALLLAAPTLTAQTGTITGRVTDAQTLQPVAAVQVSISELSIGVLTQQNGTFILINVPTGTHQVNVQRIGYRQQSAAVAVPAGGSVSREFAIEQEALALDQIIVTGTPGGTQMRAIGNAVARVDAAQIADRVAVSNMQEMLTARTPGVQFQRNTGNIGEGSEIRIRGVGSFTLGRQPLIYIDGIRVNNNPRAGPLVGDSGGGASTLDDLSPEEIESIEIIKGPAAATLYGTEASAGVIQIITKRGAVGAPQFEIGIQQGANFMIDPAGTIGPQYGCRSTPRPPCPPGDVFEYNMYDEANNYIRLIHEQGHSGLYNWDSWPTDELYRYGQTQNYSMSVRGGSETIRYFVSGDYMDDQGIVWWNGTNRANLRANLSVILPGDLTFEVSTGYVDGMTRFAEPVLGQGDVWDDMQWSNGYCLTRINPGACPRLGGFQEHLPFDVGNAETTRDWNRFTGSITAQHVFREWLTQRLVFGVDKGWDTNINFVPWDPVAPVYEENRLGEVRYARPINSNLSFDYAASARFRLNPSLGSTTSVGMQYYTRSDEELRNTGRGFAIPVQRTVNQTALDQMDVFYNSIENNSLGVYVQEEVSWNDRLYLTAAVRADDNSAFGSNFDIQTYPKVSAAWVVSEEPFWNFGPINTLRLRSALGRAGRQPDIFAARTIWRSGRGPSGAGAVEPESPGNPDVGPEVSTELEVGFDIAMLDDRLSGEFTYYKKRTDDALLDQSLPPSYGRPGSLIRNLGRLDNWGWEASLQARLVDRPNVAFDLGLTGDMAKNEIMDLGDFPGTTEIQLGLPFPNQMNSFTVLSWSEELNEFGLPVEVWCDGGAGPHGNLMGGEPVPCLEMAGKDLLLGPSYYPYTWSIAPTLTLFNNLQIFALAQGQYGKWGNDSDTHWGHNYNTSLVSQLLNDLDWLVRNEDGMFFDGRVSMNFDADFWKLRELGARYEIPQSLVRLTGGDRASISVTARNIWTIWRAQTELSGKRIPDSERAGGNLSESTLRVMPGIAGMTAALRVTF